MVMNGDKMLVKDGDKENRINMKSNKLFQQINRVMVDCIRGTVLDSKDFTTQIFENESTYLIEMTPVVKTIKELFQTVLLTIDKKDYSVQSLQMNEPSGDYTRMIFLDKKMNTTIPDEIFSL